MAKRIPTTELRLGMYINKLGGSWMQHPFIRGSFLLTDPDDIQRILAADITEVWIDEEKGSPEPRAQSPEPGARSPEPGARSPK